MADLEVTWKGLTFGGAGSYVVAEFTGWDDMPGLTDLSVPRARGHGEHLGDQFSQSRIVTMSGTVLDDPANRDGLVRALQAAAAVRSDLDTLSATVFGRELSADARVIRATVAAGPTYGVGAVPFALQWKCPDPLRYGTMQTASTGLPTPGTGMSFPMVFPMDFGTAGTPGQLTVANDGTAAAPITFTVTGPLIGGFEISAGGQRLTYPVDVSAGEVLTIDTAAGTVVTGGTADRRANLTYADWIQIPAGGSLTVQFSALGPYDPAALLSASWRSASW